MYFCIPKLKDLKLFRKKDFVALVFISLFSMGTIALFYQILKPNEILPIYQPNLVNEKLVDSTVSYISKYHTIADFNLVNQNGEKITEKDYENKIYVADFFFTTCQDICPIMTKNMYEIQEKLREYNDVLLLSHTVMPEIDTINQLKKYSIENNVDDKIWNLVTGDKEQIYNLARKSYLAAEDTEFSKYDLIHTENFILIDKKRQIRGYYDGTKKSEIERLISEIKILKNEK